MVLKRKYGWYYSDKNATIMEAKKTKNEISKYCFFWPKNQNSFDSIANPPYRSLMEREKTKNGIKKDWFFGQYNQNFFDLIANLPYRRPMEGKKLRMESKKTDFIDQKIKISLT